MGLTHSDVLVNADALCEIDIHTRKITRKSKKSEFQQYDHNSERIGFTIERMNDGHDMSQCDRVAIKYLNVRQDDMYIVDDVSVSDDGKHVTFTWLVSANATQEVGSLAFLVNFRCWNDEGEITYNWSTHPCSTYSILKGVPSMDSNPKEQYDFWAKYKGLVDGVIEDTEKVGAKLGILSEDAKGLTDTTEALKPVVNELAEDVPVLESKVSSMNKTIPILETKVGTLERTLDDDAIFAVNQEVSDIKTAIFNQGRIEYELDYNTCVNGVPQNYGSNDRLMITEMVDCSHKIKIVNNSIDYTFGVVCFEDDKSWSGADPGWIYEREYYIREYGYAYVNFKRTDNQPFSDADIDAVKESIKFYRTDFDVAKGSDLSNTNRALKAVVQECDYNDFTLEYGTLSVGVMQPGAPTRFYTPEYIKVRKGMCVEFNSLDYFFGVNVFDANKVHDGADRPWRQNDFYIDFDGYILMNFRRSDNAKLQESDKIAIKEICHVKNYIKYDDELVSTVAEKVADDVVEDMTDIVADMVAASRSKESAISSIAVEYGRLDGASYVYCRIPRVLNDGRTITPKVRLTSRDGSLNGAKRSTLEYARETNTVFVMNAGLFDMLTSLPLGQTIIDGVSIVNERHPQGANGETISDTECYSLCIDANGNLSAPYDNEADTATMIRDGVVDAVGGWGKLVENFKITQSDIDAEIVHPGKYIRQSIGQYQNGDYAVCTVDMTRGSVENEAGLTYEALAQIFIDHGVKFAYSLDGGGSAQTVIGKRQLNPIYEGTTGRKVPTVISFEVVV